MFIVRLLICLLLLILMTGCSDIIDDLNPAGNDKSLLGNLITTDYEIYDIDGNLVNISDVLLSKDAVVLYFTMWCSACDSEMSHMQSTIIPDFSSNVTFFAVDYLSSSIAQAAIGGNAWPAFTTLADINDTLENAFDGTMGITVVIDSSHTLRMKELYDDGTRLRAVLEEITP